MNSRIIESLTNIVKFSRIKQDSIDITKNIFWKKKISYFFLDSFVITEKNETLHFCGSI